MHQSPGYGAIICNAAVFQWFAPIYALYAPGYSGYIVYYIQLCSNDMLFMHLDTALLDNMEPIVRREDVVAHDYVATAGNYFIGISTHASQLSHHSPPDSPASSQLTHHEHHTRGQLRIKHHNNYTVWHQRGGDRIKTTITWMSDYRDLSTLCLIQTPQRAVVVDMWSYKNKENIGFAVISLIQ